MQFYKDLAERALKSFVGTFATTIVMPHDVWSGDGWKSAALAATAAGVSVVFSLVSKAVGDHNSASLVK